MKQMGIVPICADVISTMGTQNVISPNTPKNVLPIVAKSNPPLYQKYGSIRQGDCPIRAWS